MKYNLIFLTVLAALGGRSANADLIVNVPGCYWLQGTVTRTEPKKITVVLLEASDAEENVEVNVEGKGKFLPHGAAVEFPALLAHKGSVSEHPVAAFGNRFRSLTKFNPSRLGAWIGKEGSDACPKR